MPRDKHLRWEQQSIWVPYDYRFPNHERYDDSDVEPRFLLDDIRNSLLPYHSNRDHERSQISVTPDDWQHRRLIAEGLSLWQSHYDLAYSFREFASSALRSLLVDDLTIFEIACGYDEFDRATQFRLIQINAKTLFTKDGSFIQRIPSALAEERGIMEEIVLPADRTVRFSLPAEQSHRLRNMIAQMAAIGTFPNTRFDIQMMDVKKTVPYDFMAHDSARKAAMSAATHEIGWGGRGLFGESPNQFYEFARRLRFERFLVQMRQQVVKDINRCLHIAGQQMNLPLQLHLNNLPTLHDVNTAEENLFAGKTSFQEIIKRF